MYKPTLITLFAGGGGSSLGSKNAGCDELLAIDYEKNACDVLKLNNPKLKVWQKDMREVKSPQILEATGLQVGELDILSGSPPCPGFSQQNINRGPDNQLNKLLYTNMRFIKELQSKVFIIENVTGMVRGDMKDFWLKAQKTLNTLGYFVRWEIMNASHYGVPQARERVIIIGIRKDIGIIPTFPEPDLNNIISFHDSIGKDGYIRTTFGGEVFSGDKWLFSRKCTTNRNLRHHQYCKKHHSISLIAPLLKVLILLMQFLSHIYCIHFNKNTIMYYAINDCFSMNSCS